MKSGIQEVKDDRYILLKLIPYLLILVMLMFEEKPRWILTHYPVGNSTPLKRTHISLHT